MTGIEAKQLLMQAMGPLAVLAIALELLYFRRRRPVHELKDTLANLGLGAGAIVAETVLYGLFVFAITDWVYARRVATIPVNVGTVALLYVLADLGLYINHRLNHRVRLFWCTHVVHHSSEHMNLTTSVRRSAFTLFAGASWITYLPLIVVGFDPGWMMFVLAVNLAYQFVLHTQGIPKLHWLVEYIMCTPSHHRAHHARNARYIDRNFGGTFIIFDRLFGTFAEEHADEPPDYGAVRRPHTFNPITLSLQEGVALWRAVRQPGPLRQRLRHLWKPPEWQRPQQALDQQPQ